MAVFGFLNIDKPLGLTSHDAVARVRRELKVKKVGHAGTLDPLATGVLIICLGQATRLSEYVMDSTKRYRARVHLGVSTTTYDAEGDVTAHREIGHIRQADVERILQSFLGSLEQLPPIYSAIKQGGRKLYDIARAGGAVELQPRLVRIDALTLTDWQPPLFTMDVVCSAGTYIRSLAHDIGEALGAGAHLAGLIRTASGSFTLEQAVQLDDLLNTPDWTRFVIPPRTALAGWPAIQLDSPALEHVLHGRAVFAPDAVDGILACAYAPNGEFVAILRGEGSTWKPHKVFADGLTE